MPKPKKDTPVNSDIESAISVLETAIEGIRALEKTLDDKFSAVVGLLSGIKGRVIVSGMGKSGHVARKIAATLASTGTPALFVHPGEASHGDLGMITKDDAVILLSNSGETQELKDIIYYAKRFSIPLIGVVRRDTSTLVESADFSFILPEIAEASATIGAPTTSTTMMLVWGDALAMALLARRGFSEEDFHVFHPGGKLGSLFIKVEQLMRKGDDLPIVSADTMMPEALVEMSGKSLGCTVVNDDKGEVIGIITDGDLRRHITSKLIDMKAVDVMTKSPKNIRPEALAVEALNVMNENSVTSLCVIKANKLVGIIHIHDLLRAGVA